METRVGVGIVIRRADGRVLVGRRLTEPGRPLAVPGGKLDPGESIERCAARELAEETGLVVDGLKTFTAVLLEGWVVAGALGELGHPELEPLVREPGKFGDFAWIDPAEPPEPLFAATQALLDRLP